MTFALRILDENQAIKFGESSRLGKIFGRLEVTENGSFNDPRLISVPGATFFLSYRDPTRPGSEDPFAYIQYTPTVSINGQVITWVYPSANRIRTIILYGKR